MKRILFSLLFLCGTMAIAQTKQVKLMALSCESRGCTGSDYCSACKNCSGCKHCAKEGGTCGVCSMPVKKQAVVQKKAKKKKKRAK